MLPEFTSYPRQSKTRTVRYLDGSIGPELLPRDVILVFLIAISYEYSSSNPSVFNQLNRALLKILFLTESGSDVRAYHVWSRYYTLYTYIHQSCRQGGGGLRVLSPPPSPQFSTTNLRYYGQYLIIIKIGLLKVYITYMQCNLDYPNTDPNEVVSITVCFSTN